MGTRHADRGTIWILEDSPLEAEMARRALAPAQDVLTFGDGSILLERLATGSVPDAIILDWQLPGVSGLEVCRAIRVQHAAMDLPVLMLTVQDNKQDIVEAIAAGANDYVTKPYDVSELVARVANLVRTAHLSAMQRRRSRQLALAADIGAALTASRTLEAIATRCEEAVVKQLEAQSLDIWRTTHDGIELVSPVATPRLPKALVASVVESRKSVVVGDLTNEPMSGVDASLRALAVLPLVVGDDVVGALALASRRTLDDVAPTLRTIADLVALGVARVLVEDERAAILLRERNTRGEAEAANRSKDEFLAMVSHELRTPLNAITGWTSMLLSGGLDPERTRRALETIDRNARAQVQLIDDLLDIGRIVSGKLRLNISRVDVAPIAEMALESIRLAAEGRGVILEAQIDENVGRVQGDADRIQQVIWNLLSNAIKFTPAGGRVTLRVEARDGLVITVSDTGRGIDPDFLPRVFERFKQADGTSTRAKGGLGLGLAIVRHLVELHGGTITVASDGLGKGATFTVKLPLEAKHRTGGADAIAALDTRAVLERPRDIEGLNVLVVDDEPDARELLRALLESCKVRVRTMPSAEEAFAALRKEKIDILISDIAMPDEDGLSFIRRVRSLTREENGRVPAIALTAYARLEDRTRALRAGFNTHVAKPVDANELLAVLSSLASSR